MCKPVLSILLALVFQTAGAQVKVISIFGKTGGLFENDSFPYVRGTNIKASHKINLFLQTVILGNDSVETDPTKIFNNGLFYTTDSVTQTGLSTIVYKVILN